ncbi:hypothetical protein AWM70_15825 [Paenibacillus yonginensis]|uniref:Uncharacterized protein n=1 Tax=Paenibacillus yonginensis TaxID=1462996 RepID=A0A1B1N3A0_9BACL|nr:DUF4269 domain-containing protein [Paenibacillus yonginensis]ANS75875.1 hypothetical protein AWM70_15825 [Paenibacillus yonginensis]
MSKQPDWFELDYLKQGSNAQQEVFKLLQKHSLLSKLKVYDPVLTGTVPIRIHVEESDLDIICEVHDFRAFEQDLLRHFSAYPEFRLTSRTVSGIQRMKANFLCGAWPVEVFGQPIPVRKQKAYRHLRIEARLLRLFGESFRQQVIKLKRQGIKTEPAFSRLLGLELEFGNDNDPYQALLELEDWTDEQLYLLKARRGLN